MLSSLVIQHFVWYAVASDRFVGVIPMAGLLASALGALALAAYGAPATTERLCAQISTWVLGRRRLVTVALVVVAVAAPAFIAYRVLDRFPNSGDEFAYVFQARVLGDGHLWAPAPPLGDTFVPYRTWIIGDKWLSQYPPGWPLVMAAAGAIGIPNWSLNSLLGGASAAVLLLGLWRSGRCGLALGVVAIYLFSPFYLLNAASFYSHMLAATLIVMLCAACRWYSRHRQVRALIAVGGLLGLIGLTRYFTLILLFPALLYWLLVENHASGSGSGSGGAGPGPGRGRGRVRMLAIVIAAGLPFLAYLLLYQGWVTGNPFRSTYSLITNDDSFLSFTPANIARGASLTLHRFVELILWTSPFLLPMYVLCLAWKIKRRSIAFYDLVFPAFIGGYVFFADLGGNRYGPRYYFDAFPLVFATLLAAVPVVSASANSRSIAALPAQLAGGWRAAAGGRAYRWPLAAHALSLTAVYLLTALPFACSAFHRQVVAREEPYRLVAARGLSAAVVVIENSSGFGLDAADLARNDQRVLAPVLYARPGVTAAELQRLFPDRSVWSYRRDDRTRPGMLELIAPRLMEAH